MCSPTSNYTAMPMTDTGRRSPRTFQPIPEELKSSITINHRPRQPGFFRWYSAREHRGLSCLSYGSSQTQTTANSGSGDAPNPVRHGSRLVPGIGGDAPGSKKRVSIWQVVICLFLLHLLMEKSIFLAERRLTHSGLRSIWASFPCPSGLTFTRICVFGVKPLPFRPLSRVA